MTRLSLYLGIVALVAVATCTKDSGSHTSNKHEGNSPNGRPGRARRHTNYGGLEGYGGGGGGGYGGGGYGGIQPHGHGGVALPLGNSQSYSKSTASASSVSGGGSGVLG